MTGHHDTGSSSPEGGRGQDMKLTYDNFLRFPDDGQRHELIDGEHHVSPSPSIRHQRISRRVFALMHAWLDEHPVGEVFYAPLDVIFSRFDVVEPDLLYVSNERAAELLAGEHVTGAPDIVVEIGSPGTRRRDETTKRRLYEASSVAEYWMVDPDIAAIRVYARDGDRFAPALELSSAAGDVLTTPLLPGLEIPLSRVFRE